MRRTTLSTADGRSELLEPDVRRLTSTPTWVSRLWGETSRGAWNAARNVFDRSTSWGCGQGAGASYAGTTWAASNTE